jgi:hypothetical protein
MSGGLLSLKPCSAGVQNFCAWYPDGFKENSCIRFKRNFENTQLTFILLIERKVGYIVKHGYISFTAYILSSFKMVCDRIVKSKR